MMVAWSVGPYYGTLGRQIADGSYSYKVEAKFTAIHVAVRHLIEYS